MASIIPGYEYDIFISYRQKDNKYDGWVTEFVENLKRELEATFKEEVSVYFDINPHDGLLETHDVADSLKDKLKCLVFIPIISRTYCDPKSFAWEHEFMAFIEQAAQDQYGLKVKLPNGNVASRVLPIRIHDLDSKDLMLCESALGTYLRGVEFIYKEPGVNRPLSPYDDEKINLNKTRYRNQINKVANAVQEIISGLLGKKAIPQKEKDHTEIWAEKPTIAENSPESIQSVRPLWQKIFSGFVLAAVLILAGVYLSPKLLKHYRLKLYRSKGEISIAVMPFQNLTNDTLLNIWEIGIQNELINILTNTQELKVRQMESIQTLLRNSDLTNYASLTPSLASRISQKLSANVFVQGSIIQAGSYIRLNAQLIDSKTAEIFKTFQIEDSANEQNIFKIIDSLSITLVNYLVITLLDKELNQEQQSFVFTKSPEAYRYYLYGYNALNNSEFKTARDFFLNALAVDSNLYAAKMNVAYSYGNQGNYREAKKWALEILERRDMMPPILENWADLLYALYFKTPHDEIIYAKRMLELDDQTPSIYYTLGVAYNRINQYEKAIPVLKKALSLYENWGIKPSWPADYIVLGRAYHKMGLYRKEIKLYKRAEKDFPEASDFLPWQAILFLSKGKTKKATEYIEKFVSSLEEYALPEAFISKNLAEIYSQAGIIDQAEINFRQALSLMPENPNLINDLAFFLIVNDQDFKEGMDLVGKALEMRPDNFYFLHTYGLGLYKQGKYREAFEMLQKSWDLRRELAVYDHEAFLHLEEAKKAVANL